MTNIDEIDKAVSIFGENKCEFMLLHTVSTYPANESHLNLRCINTLKKDIMRQLDTVVADLQFLQV